LFIVLLFVFYKVNTLKITKIIPMWLFIILISDSSFSSIFTNLQLIKKPMTLDPFISHLILLNCLLPLGILFILNIYIRLNFPFKIGVIVFGILIFSGIEKAVEKLGIIEYRHWNIWFSLLLWFSIVVISVAFYHFLQTDSTKEGDDNV